MLEEEDQPVAEEEPHGLQIDGRARHQLPGLVAVEVAEREPQELRVHRVPHVELDPERLLAGDQPPPERAARLQDADREHDPDQLGNQAPVVVVDGVDDLLGQPRDRERPCLRDHRQEERDEEGALVRAQEAEQPPEGRVIARLVPVRHGSRLTHRDRTWPA